jgi:hypothetical protein
VSIARHLETAISGAFKRNLDDLARTAWKACAEGLISETEAEQLAIAIEARRATTGTRPNRQGHTPLAGERPHELSDPGRIRTTPLPRECGSPRPERGCRSPDRQKSIRRRRQIASSGAVPGNLAAHFTTGELAVLSVIARQCQSRKVCDWFMDRIAAVAGVSRTTVRNALKQAKVLGLIEVTERRRTAWRNDSNLIRIISAEWLAWLGLGIGCKSVRSTDNHYSLKNEKPLELGTDCDLFALCADRSPWVMLE